jgi:hypothetical protein
MEMFHTLIPLEFPHVVTFSTLLSNLTSLQIEDANEESWPQICKLLRFTCGNLRSLNVEAIGSMDAFESEATLEGVFPSMPKLEFVRLDGVCVGPVSSIAALATHCKSLKAVTIDYCVAITMGAFEILWNGCEVLSFLGLAGIVTEVEPTMVLMERPNLKTLRFVDCDLSDELFEEVARKAPSLEMLRIVFEDEKCEGILAVTSQLTDRTLLAFAKSETPGASQTSLRSSGLANNGGGGFSHGGEVRFRGSLHTLAISWCPNWTTGALKKVLDTNPIRVLDLHKDAECSLGELDDNFLPDMQDHLRRIETLHLFGQVGLHLHACILAFKKQTSKI